MKILAPLAAALTLGFSASGSPSTVQELSSHLFTNASIAWQAPVNRLPKSFWTYKKLLPRIFPATVISNAIVLASLQDKGFPQSSTNEVIIWEHTRAGEDPLAGSFVIIPDAANLSYSMPHFDMDSGKDIPSDEVAIKRAWNYAFQLGLDPAQLIQKPLTSHICSFDENGRDNTNNRICGRRILLSRQIDGIAFYGGDLIEGFSIEFGNRGKIRYFSVDWPNLEPDELQKAASPEQIINCIKAHKTTVIPNDGEENYFARLRTLAKAKKLTITKITPYYSEGLYGEPLEDARPKWVAPVAELEAVADFGNTNAVLRMLSPILSSDATRLLAK